MEAQCAKEDGYLPALSYLDTSRGIESEVAKLSYGLPEKWISAGSKHKDENGGQFPPFEFFSRFIGYEVRKRSDPVFAIPSTTSLPSKSDKAFYRSSNPISAHKTDVTSTDSGVKSLAKAVQYMARNILLIDVKLSGPKPWRKGRYFLKKEESVFDVAAQPTLQRTVQM